MKKLLSAACLTLVLCLAAGLRGDGTGSLVVLEPNPKRVSADTDRTYKWEPSSAAGLTWVTGWNGLTSGPNFTVTSTIASVRPWRDGAWGPETVLRAPNNQNVQDFYVAWDFRRQRFVFVVIDSVSPLSVWFGISTCSAGSAWMFRRTRVFEGSALPYVTWDFPSVAVDGSGRIIVGAVAFVLNEQGRLVANGFWTRVSPDGGITFSSGLPVGPSPSVYPPGAQSRIVATNNRFHAFIPTLNALYLPVGVDRWESTSGTTWTGPSLLLTFGAPLNSSPNNYPTPSGRPIFYAPLLDGRGYPATASYPDGLWTVAFQINNGGYNNVYTCNSSRGCGLANSIQDDQFLAGTSVSGDGGYWIAYDTFSAAGLRPLPTPLITQAIYFPPPPGLPIGATTNTGVDPLSWILHGNRCGTPDFRIPCYASGDYAGIASNPYRAASTPFVKQSSLLFVPNDLVQSFVEDPPAPPNVPNFIPNFLPFPIGADLTAISLPVPPQSVGLPPGQKIGVLSVTGSVPWVASAYNVC